MKIKYLNRKELIMRQANNSHDSMEMAFLEVLDEIMEHVIEGICFEAHRALKVGYFLADEYTLKDHKFVLMPTENGAVQSPSPENDIYGNRFEDAPKVDASSCFICGQPKAPNALGRHINSCKARSEKSMNGDVSSSDGNDNSDRKKEKDANKQQKNMATYDTMSPEETKEFLMTRCGVISRLTGRPCSKSLKCSLHSEDDRANVRSFIFESLAPHLADDNIENDTVDQ